MHYVRNIICLIVIAFAGCIFYLNTFGGDPYVKEWLEDKIRTTQGLNVKIGSVEFDLPGAVILRNVYLHESPYGPIKADTIVLKAALIKLISGRLHEGTVNIQGVKAENLGSAGLPTDLQISVSWNPEQSVFEGEADFLESKNAEFPYRLDKALFKLEPIDSSTFSIDVSSDSVRIQKAILTDVDGQGQWNTSKKEGYFSLSAKQVSGEKFLSPESSLNVSGVHCGGYLKENILHYSFTGVESAYKESSNPRSSIVLSGIAGYGEWNLIHRGGGFSLAVEELVEENISLANATLEANTDGSPYYWKYILSSEGVYDDSFVVDAAGSLVLGKDYYGLEVADFNGSFAEHSLGLVRPIKCTFYEDRNFELSGSHFTVDGKEFKLSGKGDTATMDFSLSMPKQFVRQPGSIDGTVPPVSGEFSGELILYGPYTDLQGKLSLAFDKLSIDHPAIDEESSFGLYFSADLANRIVTVSGALDDNGERLLETKGFFPVEKIGYLLIEPSKDREMQINIFGEADLVRYLHRLIPPTVWATGHTAIDVRLSGLFSAPELSGNIKLIDGNFEQWETGTLLRHINGDFDIANDRIVLHALSAYDAQGGSVTAMGELDLTKALDYPFHVDIAVNRASFADIDDMQAVLSGTMSFVGDVKGALLQGELVTDRLDFTLNDDSSSIDHDVEPEYVNQSSDEALPTVHAKLSSKWPVSYDLQFVNGEPIRIHSKEFMSHWKGDVKVTGSNIQPLLNGEFRIINGDFSLPDYLFPGKKFKISQGTISFAGELNKKTTLYIVGEMEIEDIVAQVIVKGPLGNPSLAFRSNPPLSQREILSWILFGRGMGDITSYQGAELTQSFNRLKRSGGGKNSSFLTSLTRLKENLGIDRIGIDRTQKDGKEEISLQVGKYIFPDVFLGVTRNMSSDSNRIGVEANLLKNLKLQAEVGDDSDNQLHLKWKHDY